MILVTNFIIYKALNTTLLGINSPPPSQKKKRMEDSINNLKKYCLNE